jgi:flap endonuclease-1
VGVNLSGLTEPHNVELADLRGRSVAIDAYNTIYQFLSIIRQPDGYPLVDGKGRVTSQLSGLLYRTANLIEAGIEPSFVFDGRPNEMKADTLAERKERREKAVEEWKEAVKAGDVKRAFSKAQQTSRITPDILDSSKQLLGLLGLPVILAPSDGEAQGAYMCAKGDVWASASQDFDSLLFGAPRLLRNMTISGRRKMPGKDVYKDVKTEVIDSNEFLDSLGITREQLVDVCILMGTDFNQGINGIGPKKGLKLIKDNGDLEHALTQLGQDVPGYQDVRDIFLHSTYSDEYVLKPGQMDREGVLDMLASYDFSRERVGSALDKIENARKSNAAKKTQRSLDSWF